LDSTGTVIILCKGPQLPEPTELCKMLLACSSPILHQSTVFQGQATPLESRFRVTYSMLLNLLRVEQLRIEDMLQRSYVESAALRQGGVRKMRLKEVSKGEVHSNGEGK
jgi:antiviral helicase SKI2